MNLNNYIQTLKSQLEENILDIHLEKDYMLSNFLSNWVKEETPHLDKLIFKGGTLLTKNYLKYHRISEDLDFSHKDSNLIREIPSKSQRETQIKSRIVNILEEVEKIAKLSNLEFVNNRNNKKYILQRNSRSIYILNLFYISKFTKVESSIKLEISFVENLIHKYQIQEINNIVDIKVNNLEIFTKLTNYNLKKPILKIYSIDEVILEKLRATITRKEFKPRDVFDLYMINKQKSIFTQDKKYLFNKLNASPFKFEDIIQNIENYLNLKQEINFEEVYDLSLIEINKIDFLEFDLKLKKYLNEIGTEFLQELNRIN